MSDERRDLDSEAFSPSQMPRLPPPRRRVKKRYVVLAVGIVILGWLGWMIVGAMLAKPGSLVDYGPRLEALSTAAQPEGENGWPLLIEALELMQATRPPEGIDWPTDPNRLSAIGRYEQILHGPCGFDPQGPAREELILIEAMRDAGIFARLGEAMAKPRFVRRIDTGGQMLVLLLLPELGQTRSMARARVATMRLAACEGDWDAWRAALDETMRLGRAMSYQTTIISHLVGVAIQALALQELRYELQEHDVPEAACLAMLGRMDEAWRLGPIRLGLEGERLSFQDIVQRVFTDDGRGDGILILSRFHAAMGMWGGGVGGTLPHHPIVNVAGLYFPGRRETLEEHGHLIDVAIEQSTLTQVERMNHPFDLDAYVENLDRGHIVLSTLVPALDSFVQRSVMFRSQLEAARVELALEAYHARHGEWPDSLALLAPDVLAEVPLDPINGLPFGYRRIEGASATQPDGSPDPRPYLLYSLGADGKDDGPAPVLDDVRADRYDPLLGRKEGEGHDFIFNTVRPPLEEDD